MKIIILLMVNMNLFAYGDENEDGKELHDETCIKCHISTHNKDFYINENRVVDNFFKLKAQVNRCSRFFDRVVSRGRKISAKLFKSRILQI